MPKVRMRTLYAGPQGVIPEGKVGEVDEETAAALVEGGYAELIESAAATAESKPAEPETAEAPPAPETAAKTGKRGRGKPTPPPPETAEAPPAPETDETDTDGADQGGEDE